MLIEYVCQDLYGHRCQIKDMRNASYWGPHNDLQMAYERFAFDNRSPTCGYIEMMLTTQHIVFRKKQVEDWS